MFELRVAGKERGLLGGGAASLLVHAAGIAAAVITTLHAGVVAGSAHRAVQVFYVAPPDEAARPAPGLGLAGLAPPAIGTPRLALPSSVPAVIPPPARSPFDPSLFAGDSASLGSLGPGPAGPGPAAVYAERWVEEPPEMIAHPAARYPELLRQAGIEGTAVVEAVVDTLGRVEAGSVRIVRSTNPLFDAPAREVVAGSRFRPGRVSGRPVWVRITVPVAFQVSGRSPMM